MNSLFTRVYIYMSGCYLWSHSIMGNSRPASSQFVIFPRFEKDVLLSGQNGGLGYVTALDINTSFLTIL